jgi:hypothetical protein
MRAIDDPNRYDTQKCRVYRVNIETGAYELIQTGAVKAMDQLVRDSLGEYEYPLTMYQTNDRDVPDAQKIAEFCAYIRGEK